MWEDKIAEFEGKSNQYGASSSQQQPTPQKSRTSLPPSSPESLLRSFPLPSNTQTPVRSSSTTMNGLSTPSPTPTKRDRASMSTGGHAPRRFNDPASQARRLAAIQAVTGELEAENRAAQDLKYQGMQTDKCDTESEYGMDSDGEEEPIPKRLRFSIGNVDSPLNTPTKLGNGGAKKAGSSSRTLGEGLTSPVPTGGLPDIFGIHKPRPTKQDSESPSASMFTKVNGKQRETLSSSSSRSTSTPSVKTEPDASVRPSILQILASLIPSFLSSQQLSQRPPSQSVQTPLSQINKLQDTDRSCLDAQVQEFLSGARQIQAGAEIMQSLYEELKTKDEALKTKDAEIAEVKKQVKELNSKYSKCVSSSTCRINHKPNYVLYQIVSRHARAHRESRRRSV